MAYIEKDELDAAVEKRRRLGGVRPRQRDAAIDRVLDAFAKAMKGLDPAEKRCRIEHCSIRMTSRLPRCRSWDYRRAF